MKHSNAILVRFDPGRQREIYTLPGSPGKPLRYFVADACSSCGKNILIHLSNFDRWKKGYCSPECTRLGRVGPKNHNWIGGRKNKRGKHGGHILAYAPNHPNARKGFVAEHRLVMEKTLGRLLESHEWVHHLDCDPQNNAPENLVVLSQHEHQMAHASLEHCVAKLLQTQALYWNRSLKIYEA